MTRGKKAPPEPPLFLDLDFEEALQRFVKTDPEEVRESVERAKQKKPSGDKAARRRSTKE